jgi:hypothetical protein
MLLDRLPPREDRDVDASLFGVTGNGLRTVIARACRASGTPLFSPHDLRHRRISISVVSAGLRSAVSSVNATCR